MAKRTTRPAPPRKAKTPTQEDQHDDPPTYFDQLVHRAKSNPALALAMVTTLALGNVAGAAIGAMEAGQKFTQPAPGNRDERRSQTPGVQIPGKSRDLSDEDQLWELMRRWYVQKTVDTSTIENYILRPLSPEESRFFSDLDKAAEQGIVTINPYNPYNIQPAQNPAAATATPQTFQPSAPSVPADVEALRARITEAQYQLDIMKRQLDEILARGQTSEPKPKSPTR